MNDEDTPNPKDRVIVLLSLAASRGPKSDSCPADEEISAFIDNRLPASQRRTMLTHLNSCSDCYQLWLEVASDLTETEREKADTKYVSAPPPSAIPETRRGGEASDIRTFQEKKIREAQITRLSLGSAKKVTNWLVKHLSHWHFAIPAAVAVAAASFLVLAPVVSDLDDRIDENYARSIRAHGVELSAVARTLPLPWNKAALGFGESELTASARAFGAGVWFGRNALIQSDSLPFPESLSPREGVTWQESKWKDYYSFGRCTVLLWTLAESETSAADWDAYRHLLQRLRTNLIERPVDEAASRDLIEAIERIQPLLAPVNRQSDARAYTRLSRTLLIVMERLAPDLL